MQCRPRSSTKRASQKNPHCELPPEPDARRKPAYPPGLPLPRARFAAPFLFFALGLSFCQRATPPDRARLSDIFRFSNAIDPVVFDVEAEAARVYENGGVRTLSDSGQCRECHEVVYDNWQASRHRVAFTNPLYQESHAREPSRWCVNCHAPFVAPLAENQATPGPNEREHIQTDDGVSCLVCHVREGQILSSREPEVREDHPAHDYVVLEEMQSASFCAECHQFNFLSAETAEPHTELALVYADQPMQNTAMEWWQSSFRGELTCQSCHLRPDSAESHRFPGGHDHELLSQSIHVGVRRLQESGRALLTVYTFGVGHRFPTGDLFRTLVVRLLTPGGQTVAEVRLHHEFEPVPSDRRSPGDPAKVRVSDSTVPAPQGGDYAATRSFVIDLPGEPLHELRYELYMAYLEPVNYVLTTLPLSETRPLFESGVIAIEE